MLHHSFPTDVNSVGASTSGIAANRSTKVMKREAEFDMLATPTEVTCAVEVFVATALLHREQPNRPEFTIQEIVRRAAQENITGEMRQGVNVHASQHCVANKAPNPNRHKMLYASGKNTRRLLLPGDEIHPDRTGKIFPDLGEVPERYLPLLAWAKQRFNDHRAGTGGPVSDRMESQHKHLHALPDAKGTDVEMETRIDQACFLHLEGKEPVVWLGEMLKLRLAGAHLADGIDPDEHIRQLREGWDWRRYRLTPTFCCTSSKMLVLAAQGRRKSSRAFG